MSNRSQTSRRRFIQFSAVTLATAPLLGRFVQAQEKVDPSDPTAQALNYVEDASTVDDPARQEGAVCYNCQLYQGTEDDEWAPCAIFQNKLVAGPGWCTAWVPKT